MATKNQNATTGHGPEDEGGDDGNRTGTRDREMLTFEDAMGEVEAIVDQMEGDLVPLEKLLAHYERGTRLVRLCQQRLEEAQERIELIQAGKGGAGGPTLVPFGGAPDAGPAPPEAMEPVQGARRAKGKKKGGKADDDIRLL